MAISETDSSRFLKVREGDAELNIHFHDVGAGSDVVVLLHGAGPGTTCWSNFSGNIEPLADAGFRVLLVDCPGWGRSDSLINTGSRSDLNARVVKGIIDQLGIGRIHILGNSMGGHSAVAFALTYPQLTGRLVLTGGGTGGVSLFAPMPTEGIWLLNVVYRQPTPENVRRFCHALVFDPSRLTEEILKERLANMLHRRDHLESFLKSQEANPRQFPDIGPRLPQVQAPALIIWGRQDRVVPFDTGLRLAAGIPGSELHLFNECGHWAPWEHAERFNRMTIDFLSD